VSATQLLEQSGWALAEGAQVRQSEGEMLALDLLLLDDPVQRAVAGVITEQWATLGVDVTLEAVPLDVYEAALTARSFDVALTEVIAGNEPDLYDFWSQSAIVNGHNYAAWNNRRASEALEQARQTWDVAERRAYYGVFLQLFSAAAPAITLYQHVYTYAVSNGVHNVDIGRIDDPRDRYADMQDWFLFFRDVAVSCPESTAQPPAQTLN
jgi:ABC-type transport system substrate-binding protein